MAADRRNQPISNHEINYQSTLWHGRVQLPLAGALMPPVALLSSRSNTSTSNTWQSEDQRRVDHGMHKTAITGRARLKGTLDVNPDFRQHNEISD